MKTKINKKKQRRRNSVTVGVQQVDFVPNWINDADETQ